jgi:hypothetical protein
VGEFVTYVYPIVIGHWRGIVIKQNYMHLCIGLLFIHYVNKINLYVHQSKLSHETNSIFI